MCQPSLTHDNPLEIRKVLKIAEIVIHPSYDFDSNANDVALLKVFMMFVCCNDPYVAFEDNDNEDNEDK